MKENKFNVGDVIVFREGNVVSDYIIIARTVDHYVLVSKFGDHIIRVLSNKIINKNAVLVNTMENKSEELVGTPAKACISSEDCSSTHETAKASAETYNDKLVREHKELTTYLSSLYELKNKKYGDSFGKSIRKRGFVSAIVRMEDKWNRLDNLVTMKEDGSDTDESLQDTLLDLANYCLMTVMELNHAKEKSSCTK
ncbi:nucleotide modification associated domain-containing protein [Holdemanella sp.]|uniref:nucleotide modification associated domain-containing protein n=1 Tax=Holdemanella sp. TaxID=1971762 RepID=UPI00307AC63F